MCGMIFFYYICFWIHIFAILHIKYLKHSLRISTLKTGNFCNEKISMMLTSHGVGSLIVAGYTSTSKSISWVPCHFFWPIVSQNSTSILSNASFFFFIVSQQFNPLKPACIWVKYSYTPKTLTSYVSSGRNHYTV